MPRRSFVMDLPEDLRQALNTRLVAEGFRNYEELAAWLNEECEGLGIELRVSKSAVHRHGQKFEEKLARLRLATDRAKAITEGAEDDAGAMNEALVRLVQHENFELLEMLDDLDLAPPERAQVLGKLNVGIARIVRASVASKKWMHEVRERARSAADAAAAVAKKGGLSADAVDSIRREILGIAG